MSDCKRKKANFSQISRCFLWNDHLLYALPGVLFLKMIQHSIKQETRNKKQEKTIHIAYKPYKQITKTDEKLRRYLLSINGTAGIADLKGKPEFAAAYYQKVLELEEHYRNKLNVDEFQVLHASHHLRMYYQRQFEKENDTLNDSINDNITFTNNPKEQFSMQNQTNMQCVNDSINKDDDDNENKLNENREIEMKMEEEQMDSNSNDILDPRQTSIVAREIQGLSPQQHITETSMSTPPPPTIVETQNNNCNNNINNENIENMVAVSENKKSDSCCSNNSNSPAKLLQTESLKEKIEILKFREKEIAAMVLEKHRAIVSDSYAKYDEISKIMKNMLKKRCDRTTWWQNTLDLLNKSNPGLIQVLCLYGYICVRGWRCICVCEMLCLCSFKN